MYKISKQNNEFVVANKQGTIIGYFDSRLEAEEYKQAQIRANEQSAIMFDYNCKQMQKALQVEFINEFAI
jgi:hypothetical protein